MLRCIYPKVWQSIKTANFTSVQLSWSADNFVEIGHSIDISLQRTRTEFLKFNQMEILVIQMGSYEVKSIEAGVTKFFATQWFDSRVVTIYAQYFCCRRAQKWNFRIRQVKLPKLSRQGARFNKGVYSKTRAMWMRWISNWSDTASVHIRDLETTKINLHFVKLIATNFGKYRRNWDVENLQKSGVLSLQESFQIRSYKNVNGNWSTTKQSSGRISVDVANGKSHVMVGQK